MEGRKEGKERLDKQTNRQTDRQTDRHAETGAQSLRRNRRKQKMQKKKKQKKSKQKQKQQQQKKKKKASPLSGFGQVDWKKQRENAVPGIDNLVSSEPSPSSIGRFQLSKHSLAPDSSSCWPSQRFRSAAVALATEGKNKKPESRSRFSASLINALMCAVESICSYRTNDRLLGSRFRKLGNLQRSWNFRAEL
jgi:cell pole-organizing protein PopZ